MVAPTTTDYPFSPPRATSTHQIGGELVRTTLPNKINKKMNDLRTNSKKLETLTYELALIKAGKGAVVGVEGAKESGGGAGAEKEEE